MRIIALFAAVLTFAAASASSAASPGAGSPTGKPKVVMTETPLRQIDPDILSATYTRSSDGRHTAYLCLVGRDSVLVHDAKRSRLRGFSDRLFLSPDGSRVACVTLDGGKARLVVDGKEQAECDSIENPTFTPDGKHIAWLARNGNQWVVMADGAQKQTLKGSITERDSGVPIAAFTGDGARLAQVVPQGKKQSLIVDGKSAGEFDEIAAVNFSPDGQRVACITRSGSKWSIVVDGRAGAVFDDEGHGLERGLRGPIVFSADGRHLACARGSESAIVDDREQTRFWEVQGVTFSPSGRHVAYLAQQGPKHHVVVDGQPVAEFSERFDTGSRPVFFGPQSFFVIATRDGNSVVAVITIEP